MARSWPIADSRRPAQSGHTIAQTKAPPKRGRLRRVFRITACAAASRAAVKLPLARYSSCAIQRRVSHMPLLQHQRLLAAHVSDILEEHEARFVKDLLEIFPIVVRAILG